MNLLLLGGTTEARELAGALAKRTDTAATLALAGVTRQRPHTPLPLRVGGFGGIDGLADYLRAHAIGRVIDGTHPFAGQMSMHALEACRTTDCPLWRLERPAWQPAAGDHWHFARDLDDAAARLPAFGERVFLSVGARSLAPFERIPGKLWIVRSIEAPEPPPAFLRWTPIRARPPFAVSREIALLREHAVDVLVTKNSGAAAAAAKLEAARELGVPVLMVERPCVPAPDRVFPAVDPLLEALDGEPRTHQSPG